MRRNFLMFVIVKLTGFLRRDECARQTEHLNHLLHDQFIAEKILHIRHAQTFRRQNLFHKFIHRDRLTVAPDGTEKVICRRDQRRFAHLNVQLLRFLREQQADINFAFRVIGAEAGALVRPRAVMHPVVEIKFRLRLCVVLRRDWMAVNRAVTAGRRTAVAVARRAGAHKNDKGNDGEAGDQPPQPARMFANCSNHSEKK